MRTIAMLTAGLVLVLGCGGQDKPKNPAPAKVANGQPEGTAPTVTLTQDAVKRLGLEVAPIEHRVVGGVRQIGGEVVPPPGGAVSVVAPVAGTVAGDMIPAIGTAVATGQVLLNLAPLSSQADASRYREDLDVARARATASRAEIGRVRSLHKDGLVSTRDLEQAEAEAAGAEALLRGAEGRASTLDGRVGQGAGTVTIRSPYPGRITEVHVAPGQSVPQGAPLATVQRSGRVWVKVPVFAGDVARIHRSAPAAVRSLRASTTDRAPMAHPVTGPLVANTANGSIDLYYALEDGAEPLQIGERVDVSLPLKESAGKQLVAPWSAILRDAQGGTWIYEKTGATTFSRRPVSVRSLVGDWAVLERGPAPGTMVVSVAAAELFGTEFGTGK